MKRIGILTSGGDCQGLNAAIRAVGKTLYERFGNEVEIFGIRDGYRGLIQGDYYSMTPQDFSGILTLGGTVLGTSRQPFKQIRIIGEDQIDKVAAMKSNYKKLRLDCLVILGGNGTHKTANLLREEGLNVITLPKTIDNDLWGTDMTFGFQSALEIATNVIDCIHTTADSHSRIFIVEVMGHKVGWLPLFAGIAGGADVILIPEIPYSIDTLVENVHLKDNLKKRFCILAVAEGAISVEESKMTKKEFKSSRSHMPYPSISYRIAREIGERTGREIRVTVPGHFQRGGSPCPADRVLATRFGTAAANLISQGNFGNMVAVQGDHIVPVPLSEVAGRLKTVPTDLEIIQSSRDLGIHFGDE